MESNYKRRRWFIISEITSGPGSVKHVAGWWSKGAIACDIYETRKAPREYCFGWVGQIRKKVAEF